MGETKTITFQFNSNFLRSPPPLSPRTGKHSKRTLSTSVGDHMLDCNHMAAGMTSRYWGGSLIIGFWRLRRVYLLKEIGLRLIRIFTPRNCFYFNLTMSAIKL